MLQTLNRSRIKILYIPVSRIVLVTLGLLIPFGWINPASAITLEHEYKTIGEFKLPPLDLTGEFPPFEVCSKNQVISFISALKVSEAKLSVQLSASVICNDWFVKCNNVRIETSGDFKCGSRGGLQVSIDLPQNIKGLLSLENNSMLFLFEPDWVDSFVKELIFPEIVERLEAATVEIQEAMDLTPWLEKYVHSKTEQEKRKYVLDGLSNMAFKDRLYQIASFASKQVGRILKQEAYILSEDMNSFKGQFSERTQRQVELEKSDPPKDWLLRFY